MWKWLEENHPIINELIWWGVIVMCVVSIAINLACISSTL